MRWLAGIGWELERERDNPFGGAGLGVSSIGNDDAQGSNANESWLLGAKEKGLRILYGAPRVAN